MEEPIAMKPRRWLLLFLTLVLAAAGSCGIWVWKAQQQYTLNRELIAALVRNDSKQALALVNRGANPNTRYAPPPSPTLKLLLNQLLRRPPISVEDSPTAFLLACGGNQFLPDMGANVIAPSPDDAPLVQAMLAHGANGNLSNPTNTAPLFAAVTCGHLHVAQALLEHGANVNQVDTMGLTPLTLVVAGGDADTTRLLLEHGANVSQIDGWGNTALTNAVSFGKSMICVRLLLAHGADPNQKDAHGETALTIAQEHNRPDIVALLRRKR